MNFGEAFQHLLQGRMIKRTCWTTRKLRVSGGYPIDNFGLPLVNERNPAGQLLQHLLVTSGNSVTWGEGHEDWEPYVISNQDLFAHDWEYIPNPMEQFNHNILNGLQDGANDDVIEQREVEHRARNPIQTQENKEVFYIVKPKKLKIRDEDEIVDMDFAAMYPEEPSPVLRLALHDLLHERQQQRQAQQIYEHPAHELIEAMRQHREGLLGNNTNEQQDRISAMINILRRR